MKKYVLGFAFDKGKRKVVLILKNYPEFQRNKFNGIGGEIKDDESPAQAMCREFFEETGAISSPTDWYYYTCINHKDYIIYCFCMYSDIIKDCSTVTEEIIVIKHVSLVEHLPLVTKTKELFRLALLKDK
jgi:8-oxo-dGTP pyrophosphatase MutT (NUDIX family)